VVSVEAVAVVFGAVPVRRIRALDELLDDDGLVEDGPSGRDSARVRLRLVSP
jgi:hypothetical protein